MRKHLTDAKWTEVAGRFDPPGRRGAPARYSRRLMVEAMLWVIRTGAMWTDLPAHYPPWRAVWQQLRRWEQRDDLAQVMTDLREDVRMAAGHPVNAPLLMVDAQTVRGARTGPTFHQPGGRHMENGAKRTRIVDDMGLVVDVRVDSARPHDLTAARMLVPGLVARMPSVKKVLGDVGYRGLDRNGALGKATLVLMAPPPPAAGVKKSFIPLVPLVKVEHAHARGVRWRRLSRCYEGSALMATAILRMSVIGDLLKLLD